MLVELIGTNVFVVDRESLRAIANGFKTHLAAAFDGEMPNLDAVARLIERVELVHKRFEHTRNELSLLQEKGLRGLPGCEQPLAARGKSLPN